MTQQPPASGRVALVTGAARGLGAAIAGALVEAGHRVMFADIDAEAAEAQAGRHPAAQAHSTHLDVRARSSIEQVVAACTSRFGAVDILVNNAALTQACDFFALTEAQWDEVAAVNMRSLILTCQTIAPGMVERGFGRIINLSSIAGQRGGPQVQGVHYAASKAAIIGMTRYLAHLFAGDGITVNAIAPGPIESEQTALLPQDRLDAVRAAIPVGRLGRPEEVASLVAYLCSRDAGFITGATYDINGGLLMR